MKMVLLLILAVISFTLLPQSVLAHSPANMVLEYDFNEQKLDVEITHNVIDPNSHYIENVKVWRNDNLIIDQDYTSQPSTSSFTYSYDITALEGDVLRVTSTCNIGGSDTKQITVSAPKPPTIDLSVNPIIATIDENSSQDFTITISSDDDPLDGSTVTITTVHGSISNENPIIGGKYDFKYTAPEVTEDITETINITASKSSYNPGYFEFQFKLEDTDAPSKPELVIGVNPYISEIAELGTQLFTISITSDSQPIDDVTLNINAQYGTISDQKANSGGEYEFKYTANEISQDTSETVTITAVKDGYNDDTEQLQFTITNQIPDNGRNPTLDGIIEEYEYEFSASFGGGDFILHWGLSDETLAMAIEGRTTGWVSIGFEPRKVMKDADMIFGWVTDDDEVKVLDTFSTGEFGPHPPDTELGGTDDILQFGGSEKNGWTIIEFTRFLDTDDDYDNKLWSEGEIDIIWAMGTNDNFETQHSQVGSGTIDLATGESSEDIKLWPFHAIFMILGFIFMVIASIIAHFKKKIKWWLKAHRAINIFSTIFAILGLIMGIYMVSELGGTHFRVPHSYIGLVTIIFVIITPILGFKMLNPQSSSKKLRAVHRVIGRITIFLMLLNILIGLSLVGII